MEKLTPQNKHEEHLVQVLLAKMQGVPVEYKRGADWCRAVPNSVSLKTEYRIVPQPTPLPISREIWAMIAEEWKWAAMDQGKSVSFFTHKPTLYKPEAIWGFNVGNYCNSVLAINTDGISWERSLTERPEDV